MKIIGNIRQALDEKGHITIPEFISEAMYNIHEGYYIKTDPIGKTGDFITAPEISQLFGEMIGVYSADLWIKMGQPKEFNLVELGPGHGTLMDDLLRSTKNVPGFHQACRVHFVEKNKRLIQVQKSKLSKYKIPFNWHQNVYNLPNDLPMIVIANEFFDCLPINQYIKIDNQWFEQAIALNNTEFSFIQIPINLDLSISLDNDHPNAKSWDIIEICYPALEIIQHFAKLFQYIPGSMLIIDYGYDEDPKTRKNYNSTLQAIKDHKFHPIFQDIGRADITAHVDFLALRQSSIINQCLSTKSVTQREFLLNLGIALRAEILKNVSQPTVAKTIQHGLDRLIAPDQMGNLFKAMIIYSKDLSEFLAKG